MLDDVHVTPFDVARMMSLLKLARSVHGNPADPDHYIDDAGYTSLAGSFAVGDAVVEKITPPMPPATTLNEALVAEASRNAKLQAELEMAKQKAPAPSLSEHIRDMNEKDKKDGN